MTDLDSGPPTEPCRVDPIEELISEAQALRTAVVEATTSNRKLLRAVEHLTDGLLDLAARVQALESLAAE